MIPDRRSSAVRAQSAGARTFNSETAPSERAQGRGRQGWDGSGRGLSVGYRYTAPPVSVTSGVVFVSVSIGLDLCVAGLRLGKLTPRGVTY